MTVRNIALAAGVTLVEAAPQGRIEEAVGPLLDGPAVDRVAPVRRVVASHLMVVVIGLTGMVALAGCASTKKAVLGASAAKVYQTTIATRSARFRSTFTVTASSPGAGESALETGVFSWAKRRGEFTQTSLVVKEYRSVVREIVDGPTIYSRLVSVSGPWSAQFSIGFPSTSGWAESKISGSWGGSVLSWTFGPGFLPDEPDLAPSALVGVLEKSSSSSYVGTANLDGVRVAHYRARVPLRSMLGTSSRDFSAVARLLQMSDVSVGYWVDAAGRLRRLTMSETIEALKDLGPGTSTGATEPPPATTTTSGKQFAVGTFKITPENPIQFPVTISVSVDLWDYGVPAEVPVPPSSEVTSRQSCTVSESGETCES